MCRLALFSRGTPANPKARGVGLNADPKTDGSSVALLARDSCRMSVSAYTGGCKADVRVEAEDPGQRAASAGPRTLGVFQRRKSLILHGRSSGIRRSDLRLPAIMIRSSEMVGISKDDSQVVPESIG